MLPHRVGMSEGRASPPTVSQRLPPSFGLVEPCFKHSAQKPWLPGREALAGDGSYCPNVPIFVLFHQPSLAAVTNQAPSSS